MGLLRNTARARADRSERGLSLIEVLIAGVISMLILYSLDVALSIVLRSVAWQQAQHQTQAELLWLQETLGQDIHQATSFVSRVTLDGQRYETEPTATTLVLRLPSIDSAGDVLPDAYDFVVYQLTEVDDGEASLSRRVFTTRDSAGAPGAIQPGSVRIPGVRVLVRNVMVPQGDGDVPPLLQFDQPSMTIAREVAFTLTRRSSSWGAGRAGQLLCALRFRLRNS